MAKTTYFNIGKLPKKLGELATDITVECIAGVVATKGIKQGTPEFEEAMQQINIDLCRKSPSSITHLVQIMAANLALETQRKNDLLDSLEKIQEANNILCEQLKEAEAQAEGSTCQA